MTRLDLDTARALFGQMLVNAQTLERLLRDASITLPPTETTAFAWTIREIQTTIIRQTEQLQHLELAAGLAKPLSDRRKGVERRLKAS